MPTQEKEIFRGDAQVSPPGSSRELNTLMHADSRARLAEHLRHMRVHATDMHMLFMRVRTTADGMLAGCRDGELELDFPCPRVADFARSGRFLAYCRQNGLQVTKQRWGTDLVYRASLGIDIANAVALIARGFQAVYRPPGEFTLDLKGDGWHPA